MDKRRIKRRQTRDKAKYSEKSDPFHHYTISPLHPLANICAINTRALLAHKLHKYGVTKIALLLIKTMRTVLVVVGGVFHHLPFLNHYKRITSVSLKSVSAPFCHSSITLFCIDTRAGCYK